jgi:hypothetical protein
MSQHRYQPKALMGDYGRAAVGLALTLGPAMLVPTGSGALYVLVPLALLFAVFAARTAMRQMATVDVSTDGIAHRSWRQVELAWPQLSHLKVDYYSTRGDRTQGWMQLTAKAGARAVRVDSAIDDFVVIARAAAAAARSNGVALSDATRANLGHLGIESDDG